MVPLYFGVSVVLVLLNAYVQPCASVYWSKVSQKKNFEFKDNQIACKIYCSGPLLRTVQMAGLFKDSKKFVDMKLKYHPNQTMNDFIFFMWEKSHTPTRNEIGEFVNKHFEGVGKEFVPWIPNDWVKHPAFIDTIHDYDLRQWAHELNNIWKKLGRKMNDDVYKNPEYYSIIPVPYPVIVPGGRFNEFYYWDSYWIIRGLLYCEMFETVRGMLLNYFSIVQRFGYIPNGGRIYYKGRSQPPLLASMVKSYVEFTNDDLFAIDALPVLEREFDYWMTHRTIKVRGHRMAIYNDESQGPRPESYREDIEMSSIFTTAAEKESYYKELKAAAESGMDFSSRWFINKNGTNTGNLTNLKTRSIVPVELNAILYRNAKIIEEFYMLTNNAVKVLEYQMKAENILKGIEAVLWHNKIGAWLDYDLINRKPRNYFTPTNLSPLWMKAYNISNTPKISGAVLKYIRNQELYKYIGGIPNTLYKSGQQWDYPNVWPPMEYILIEGLETLGTERAKELSRRWCYRWLSSNFETYRRTHAMFEKYDANRIGGVGSGGEYQVQTGFGWTNGIDIEFLAKYGRELRFGRSRS